MTDKAKVKRQRVVKPAGVRCMFCTHWADRSPGHGQCNRYPTPTLKEYTDWCGEFKAAKDSERQEWPD